ncbi:MAG TPA: ATP phosphoribosyltransferase regulatory subunit [Kofleriaceae bacterium]|nr:ATP phosphoribosyltransferase regulatory subunit [Kofleriaceae bacterium]
MLNTPNPRIRLPAGVRDFLPPAAARRRALSERLLGEFERWGFERIITPLFECADVLERGLGADAHATAIRFVEPVTGEVVALRPDITPQVARLVATRMNGEGGPIRLCYEGAVARMATGARGQREILQAGVELYGAGAPEGDAEVIAVAAAALAAAHVPEVGLDVGHVGLVRHVLEAVAEEAQRAELAVALRKKDRDGVARAAAGLPRPLRALVEALPTLYGEPAAVLERARELRLPPPLRRGLALVEEVLEATAPAAEASLGRGGVTLDLGEVRGFDYYTGIRLAGYVAGAGEAVLRGGRYDQLAARYGKSSRAIGFAVDIEAMAEAQSAAGLPLPARPEGVLVAAVRDRRREAGQVAAALRAAGHRAAVDLAGPQSRRALVAYARRVGFTCVLELSRDGAAWLVEGAAAAEIPAAAVRRASTGDGAALVLPRPAAEAAPAEE